MRCFECGAQGYYRDKCLERAEYEIGPCSNFRSAVGRRTGDGTTGHRVASDDCVGTPATGDRKPQTQTPEEWRCEVEARLKPTQVDLHNYGDEHLPVARKKMGMR